MSQKRKTLITLGILVVVLVVIAGVSAYLRRDAAASAKVGDCMQQTGANSLKVVKCDDKAASFVVIGRVENTTETDASISSCAPYQDKGLTSSYWEGEDGKPGMVLCLAKH